MAPGWRHSLAAQIALGVIALTSLAIGLIATGVLAIGRATFARLMADHGVDAPTAHAMFDESVTAVTGLTAAGAIVVSVLLGISAASRLAQPLQALSLAARRIAAGDYAARVPRRGPVEVASLADSFNQMAAAIEEQERLRREFIANAAHELRTPLTNLTGYLEALRDGIAPADPATFDSLLEEAERLVRLSRSLDVLAEGDAAANAPPMVELDLAAAIHGALELAGPAFERARISVEADVPDGLGARGDPDRLAQVLGNLLANAARYAPAGGRVTVRAEPRPGEVLVAIANTGDAIPATDLPHLFERFYRVDKSRDRHRGGSGIGLAIVEQLVAAAGGRVGVESVPGLTRFWFTLPA
ncbi:MAG TPA: ATP-binding protein [Candidatus Limnocylindrales bacterium]|nr:ATP-binding protein [Candidatus Limnocylindrales bacterium]